MVTSPFSSVPVFSTTDLSLIDTDEMESIDDFLTYMYDHLAQPSSRDFMHCLIHEFNARNEAADIEVDDDPLWQFLDILNSYLMQRHKFLSDPGYLDALVACVTCEGTSSTELTDLFVALNQPSSIKVFMSIVDELLFWTYLFGSTGPSETRAMLNGYLSDLKLQLSQDNPFLLSIPTMFPAYVNYLNTLVGAYDDDDVISISSSSNSMLLLTTPQRSTFPLFQLQVLSVPLSSSYPRQSYDRKSLSSGQRAFHSKR